MHVLYKIIRAPPFIPEPLTQGLKNHNVGRGILPHYHYVLSYRGAEENIFKESMLFFRYNYQNPP